ncbi:peptide MFS transporter [Bariatricus sp. SGI.154]|uniref:peptide MFS transporter n=1 Tax=Bariatricus sp. SGI.154 TaxID=3420549 RepID=UPI003CFD7D90
MSSTKKKWPFGFYVCSFSFTLERFAYYAAKWGVAVFVALEAAKGGLGLTTAEGAVMSSQLVAWTYITPIIGGYIADRWISPRLLVPIGEILMGLGYLCAWQAQSKSMMWAMIILLAIGTGLFKGNVSGINGRLFPLADPDTLDSVFNIQYMFVNIGSFCGTTFLCLVATEGPGFRTMYLLCGVALFLDVIWWLFGTRFFGDAGKKPFKHDSREEKSAKTASDDAPLTKLEKNRVIAILIVTVFSGIFWLIWYMAYMPVYYEFGPIEQAGQGWANWNIGSFQMPTSWFDSLNGLLCIVLCPVFAGIWAKMKQRPQGDWGMFTKTALGIIILGLTPASMVLAAFLCGEGTKDPVGIWVIILAAVCMTFGEVIFSPLGNSFINKYSPKKLLGTMLGVWPLVIFFAGLGYGPLYNWLATFSFVKAYGIVTILIMACGFIMLAFTKKFDEMVGGK